MQIRRFYPYFAVLAILGPLCRYWLRHTPRRLTPLRRRLLLGVRLLVLALLIAGLVRLSLTQVSQHVNVVFLLDLSDRMAAAICQQALDFIRAVTRHKPPHDGVGLVVFGADAALGLFVVDIAVRQVFLPAAWTARWQRRAVDQRRRSMALRQTYRAAASTAEQAPSVTVARVRHRQTDT